MSCAWCGERLTDGACPHGCDEDCICGSPVGDCSAGGPCPEAEAYDRRTLQLVAEIGAQRLAEAEPEPPEPPPLEAVASLLLRLDAACAIEGIGPVGFPTVPEALAAGPLDSAVLEWASAVCPDLAAHLEDLP